MVYSDGKVLSLADYQHGTFPFIVHTFASHGETRLHSHPFSEIVYVRSGTAVHCYQNSRYPLFAGDCFVISPGGAWVYRLQEIQPDKHALLSGNS